MKFFIHQSPLNQQWYVAIKAGNGETWFTSEGYDSKSNAERSVERFQTVFAMNVIADAGRIMLDIPVEFG